MPLKIAQACPRANRPGPVIGKTASMMARLPGGEQSPANTLNGAVALCHLGTRQRMIGMLHWFRWCARGRRRRRGACGGQNVGGDVVVAAAQVLQSPQDAISLAASRLAAAQARAVTADEALKAYLKDYL